MSLSMDDLMDSPEVVSMGWVRMIRAACLWCALLSGALASGCGSDDVGPMSRMVGGRCTVASDCVDRCETSGQFPGGYCTVSCAANRDCPGGSTCAAINGGICLGTCQVNDDCTGYGVGYTCGRLAGQSSGAEALACKGS